MTATVIGQATGTIEVTGDSDWFKVQLQAGTEYVFDVGNGTLTTPGVSLYDSSGNLLVSGTGGGANGAAETSFVATTTGTYYVGASSLASGTGTYTVTESTTPYDFAGNVNTTGTIAVGGQVASHLSAAGQSEWFKVQLQAGTQYVFSIASGSLSGAEVNLYDASGKYIVNGYDEGQLTATTFTYTPTASGSYFVGATDTQSGTGAFTVSVSTSPYNYASNINTTGVVSVGSPVSDVISVAGQSEWFKVQLQAGTQYVFDVGGGTLSSSGVSLYDGSGNLLVQGFGGGANGGSRTSFTPTAGGTYFVSAEGTGAATGTFTVAVSTSPYDYAGNVTTTGTVAVGNHVSDNISTVGQSEWFKVQLQAGTQYVFNVGGGTLSSPVVTLYDASGHALVAGSGSGSTNAVTSFEPTASGTYYIGASSGQQANVGTFTVSVSTAGYDYAGTVATTGTVAVGSHVSDSIGTVGQSEWFKVQLQAGTQYVFDVGGGTLSSAAVTLYDSSGNQIVNGTGGGSNGGAETSFTPLTSGTYFVGASGPQSTTGTFTLSVSTATDDYSGNIATTGSIKPVLTAAAAISSFQQGQLAHNSSIQDSAANVQANLDGLGSIAAAGLLSSIALTDSGTPTLTVTAAQTAQDQKALESLTGSYNLLVSGYSASVSLFETQQDAHYVVGTSHPGSNQVVGFQSTAFSSGSNAVVLDGGRSQYQVQIDGTGQLVVNDTVSHQSITVTGDTYTVFNGASQTTATVYDQAIFIASGGDAALARLYQSTFGRLPDLQGFEAWRGVLDSGALTINQVAQDFETSNEFQSHYGTNTTDQQYVDALYTNVLGRAADTSGEAAWVTYLTSLTQQAGQTAARGTVLLDFATSQEEITNSSSWLVDPTTGGYADSGSLLPATTVVFQATTHNYLNTALIDPTTVGAGVTTTAFQLSGSGSSAGLTILAAAPAETILLSANFPSVSIQNANSTINAGPGADTISIDGGTNTTVALNSGGTSQVYVLGGTNTMIKYFASGSGTAIDVANTTSTNSVVIADGSHVAVNGANLAFDAYSTYNFVVNVGSIGDGSAATVAAAANKAYTVGQVAYEHVTFMGTDSGGNTEFWFFGSTAGVTNGSIPASSLANSADANGNGIVDAAEITHVATLVGVTAASLAASDLA